MTNTMTEVERPRVVAHVEWTAARKEFLAREKEFTRLRDELSRQRRELPWEKVEKEYEFDGLKGRESLADLFDGRSQLVIYHFMLGPGWKEGCPSCSFLADHFEGPALHLAHRDVTLALVSHAPITQIEAFKKRMGWKLHWVSSFANDFNYDYHVSFRAEDRSKGEVEYNYGLMDFPSEEGPGLSVFAKNPEGQIFHTYSSYARGLDILLGTYNFLDLVPKGRDEAGLKHSMAWVRHHDKYDQSYFVDADQPYIEPAKVEGSCCHDH
jgi:predicted dithiol-disulfide oxidoreductase (DUF899 family)